MRPALPLLTALLFAAPLAFADPGGSDSPDRWQDALDVAPGEHHGTLGTHGGDHDADWFRVTHPAGKGVRATLNGPLVGRDLQPLTDSGARATLPVAVHHGNASYFVAVASDPVADAVRFGVVGFGDYAITFEIVDVMDGAVTDLKVRNSPTCGIAPDCVDHGVVVVTVTLENRGGLPYNGSVRIMAWTEPRPVLIDDLRLTLSPGATLTYERIWRAVAVGTVPIEARANSGPLAEGRLDSHFPDNVRTVDHTLFVAGPPLGGA